MRKPNLELKVGLFVLVALAGLTWLVVRSGDFYMKPGYTVRFLFDTVTGIDSGSPVCLAGVPVGDVTEISVVRDASGASRVEVQARIRQGVQIEEDAEVRVSALGLLGEKFVDIAPGTAGKPLLANGSVLGGSRSNRFDNLADAGTKLVNKLDEVADHIRDIVSDPKFKENVRGTFGNANDTFEHGSAVMKNMEQASDDLKEAAKSARIVLGRLRDGEGTIGRLLKDDKMAKDLEAFAAEIKKNPWRLLKRD